MDRVLKIVILALVLVTGLVMAGCSTPTGRLTTEGELSTYQLEIDLLGEKNEFLVDSQGRLTSKVEASSAAGRIILFIDKGTTLLDRDGKPIEIIRAIIDPSPPPPLEDACIVGAAYSLTPQGATFDPWLMLTLGYDSKKLPEGINEGDLYVAYHDGSEWHELRYKKVDTEVDSVTTKVYHFTSFAILAPKESPPPSPPTPDQGTRVGDLAPDFQLEGLDGQTVSLGDLRGRPVMLNFWASWCNPCKAEMPFIQEVFDDKKWSDKGLVILAINIGESLSKVEGFMKSYNLSFPVLLDREGKTSQKYNIRGIPATFFIDKNGIIQDRKIGAFLTKSELESRLSKIVQ